MSMMSDDYRLAIRLMRQEAHGDMRVVDKAWSQAMKDSASRGKGAPELKDVLERIKENCGNKEKNSSG